MSPLCHKLCGRVPRITNVLSDFSLIPRSLKACVTGCGIPIETDRHCRPPPSGNDRVIFSMGFPEEVVRRALRRTRDNEARAIELLLQGDVAEGEERRERSCPAEWTGSSNEFQQVMAGSIDLYMAW